MFVSIANGDTNKVKEVYLDEKLVTNCIDADDRAGYIRITYIERETKILKEEVLYGKVRIVLKNGLINRR